VDDLALTSYIVANASSLLHHLENVAKDIGHYINALKSEHINHITSFDIELCRLRH